MSAPGFTSFIAFSISTALAALVTAPADVLAVLGLVKTQRPRVATVHAPLLLHLEAAANQQHRQLGDYTNVMCHVPSC